MFALAAEFQLQITYLQTHKTHCPYLGHCFISCSHLYFTLSTERKQKNLLQSWPEVHRLTASHPLMECAQPVFSLLCLPVHSLSLAFVKQEDVLFYRCYSFTGSWIKITNVFFHQERLVKAIYFISTTNCGTSCKLQIQILGSDLAKIHVTVKHFHTYELIFYSENFCTLEKLEELQIDS